jgi:hypothetical protein
VAIGAWRGALATGLGIATLLLSYGAAVFLGPVFGPAVGERLGLAALLAIPLASTLAFIAAYTVLGLVSRLAQRLGQRENVGRSPRDRFLGGSFGAVRGVLLAIMVVYLAMWADALRATGNAAMIPEVGDSVAADLTGGIVKSAIETAFDASQPTTRFAARFAAHPGVAAADFQHVIDDPNFTRLREDAEFWSAVENGNLDAAFRRGSFQTFQHDAQLRQKLAQLGLVPDEAAFDAEVFRQAVAQVLEEVGPRLRDLRSDPALQDLLADPAVVAMIQSGDTLGLVSHPGFRELVDRIMAAPAPN